MRLNRLDPRQVTHDEHQGTETLFGLARKQWSNRVIMLSSSVSSVVNLRLSVAFLLPFCWYQSLLSLGIESKSLLFVCSWGAKARRARDKAEVSGEPS